MKRFFYLLFLFPLASLGQGYIDYYNNVSEAEWLFDNKKFHEAESILKRSFKLVETAKNRDLWLYLTILKTNNKHGKAFRCLKKHIKSIGGTFFSLRPYLIKKEFEFSEKQFNKLDRIKLDTTKTEYVESMKFNLVLNSLVEQDQKIRLAANKLGDSFSDSVLWITNSDTTIVNRLDYSFKISEYNDSILKDLLLSRKLIYAKYINHIDLRLLLLHMNYENFIEIESELIEMIDQGNMEPYDYACAKDRKYTENGDCIIYFAYTLTADNFSCIDIEQVFENRKKIGLTTFYTRTSMRRHIKVNSQMKYPLTEYVKTKKL